MFYNDAAPLALEFGAARVGHLGAFWEAWRVGCEAGWNRLSAAPPTAAIAQWQQREVVVENHESLAGERLGAQPPTTHPV